jgi:predicted Zn finger-like uncharacterized protein
VYSYAPIQVSAPCTGPINLGVEAMLAICEDCSKKYNIDESKIKGTRARFSCQECGHIIVVVKSEAEKKAEEEWPNVDAKNERV